MKQPAFFLEHIHHFATLLAEIGAVGTLDAFMQDPYLVMAAERAVNNIGEAVSKIDAKFKARYPEIPWQQMRGMRNLITHAYWEVNHDILWEVVSVHAPHLRDQVAKILTLP